MPVFVSWSVFCFLSPDQDLLLAQLHARCLLQVITSMSRSLVTRHQHQTSLSPIHRLTAITFLRCCNHPIQGEITGQNCDAGFHWSNDKSSLFQFISIKELLKQWACKFSDLFLQSAFGCDGYWMEFRKTTFLTNHV